MKESYFIKNYRKRWRYRIIALIACAIAILGSMAVGIYTYYNNKNNPVVVENLEDYKRALNNDSYIQISADKIYDLNVDVINTTSKLGIPLFKEVKSKFIAIDLAPYTLAVEVPKKNFEKFISKSKGHYVLKGKLIEFEDNDLESIKNAMKNNYSLSKGANLETYFQYLRYESPINSALVYFTVAVLLLIFILILYIRVMRKNSVALKSLKNFSNDDFETTCHKIDNELASPNIYKNGPISITKNYIVVQTQQIVFALPLKELMWVYRETIKKKACLVVPCGRYSRLKFVFSDKNTYTVDLYRKEEIIDEVINYISKNCKTCFVVYTDEFEKLFKKNCDEFILKWRCHKENSVNM